MRRVSRTAGLLLTGGASSRLGVAKAELRRDGERLADRGARLLASACTTALEVGPGVSALAAVREVPPGAGPLAAVVAGAHALARRDGPGPVLVLAVDLPFVEASLLRWLVEHPAPGTVVPRVDGRAQPLCARYAAADLVVAAALRARGAAAMQDLLAAVSIAYEDEAGWGAVATAAAFTDVDTPDAVYRAGLTGPASRLGWPRAPCETASPVDPAELLQLFVDAADAEREAVARLVGAPRRARTDRPGQYRLDVVADDAVLEVLHRAPVRVVSEESGASGPAGAPITVVVDPVDGSTNCSRHIPYWGISLCALDHDGPLCALVVNSATGERYTAVRGQGAWSDDGRLRAASTTELEGAVIAVAGLPRPAPWQQFRALGSLALALCDVAAGRLDGFLDALADQHAPWDYLGGLLACREAGAVVVDAAGRDLVTGDPDARRQVLAGATPRLLDALRAGVA